MKQAQNRKTERMILAMLIAWMVLFLVLGITFACCAGETYYYRNGYYYDSAGKCYTYSQQKFVPYTPAVTYDVPPAPKYAEPAKYEQKYDDAFDASLGRAIETRAKADADLERLVFQTNAQVQKLRAVLGGRGLVRGYDPYLHRDVAGNAYTGSTQYQSRTSTTYLEAYGKPVDIDGQLTRFARGAENQIQAGRDLHNQLGGLIDQAAKRQAESARAIVEADGTTAKLHALDGLLERFGQVLGKLDTPRTTVVQQESEVTPAPSAASRPASWQPVEVPLLKKYCGECHTGTSAKAGLVLDGLLPLAPVEALKVQLAIQRKPGAKPMPPNKPVDPRDVNGVHLEVYSLVGQR